MVIQRKTCNSLVSILFKSISNFKEAKNDDLFPSITLQHLQSQKPLRKHKDPIVGDGFFWKKI